jgi:hypothetical protein
MVREDLGKVDGSIGIPPYGLKRSLPNNADLEEVLAFSVKPIESSEHSLH